jgi:copper chaperone CopZ
MKTYTFKTNINCGGCIAKVSPHLNAVEGIKWEVDINVPEKILTVETENLEKDEIIKVVSNAGFKIVENNS